MLHIETHMPATEGSPMGAGPELEAGNPTWVEEPGLMFQLLLLQTVRQD